MPSVSKIDEVNSVERGLFYQLMKHDSTRFIFVTSTFLHSMATRSFARWPTDENR